jgi:hypothetical protein
MPTTPVELETIRGLVQEAALSDEARSTALWCLSRLPGLYDEFCRTRNVRQGDEARRLVEWLLGGLADDGLKARVTDQLAVLHARLGIQVYRFAPAKQRGRPKKGKAAPARD